MRGPRIGAWLEPLRWKRRSEFVGREAFQSDLRELRPETWARVHPRAHGCEVEQAMLLSGVGSADFARVVGIELAPHLVTPVDDIVAICRRHASECLGRADLLRARFPAADPSGPPPLPSQRREAREAEHLLASADAWNHLADLLVSNRWE